VDVRAQRELVRAITFKTVSGSAGSRNVIFTVSDGDGGLSAEVSRMLPPTKRVDTGELALDAPV